MFLQQRHAAEGARADTALVLLHLGMGLQMGPQVGTVSEGPIAVGAGERPLTWREKGEKTRYMNSLSTVRWLGSQELSISTSLSHTHTHIQKIMKKHMVDMVGSEPE